MKGLVLEGGGTKGAYQVGAYKALRDLGIDFQGVSGTSIGALNGAYIIQNDIDIIEEIWYSCDYTKFMNIDEEFYQKYKNIDFTPKCINPVLELINKALKNEGIDITPLKKLITSTIREDIIRSSNKDFGLTTVWFDKKINPLPLYIEDIPEGRLSDYLIASASLPIFQFEKMDDKLYLDGMFLENIPVSLLQNKGYKDIVVIRLMNDFIGNRSLNKYQDCNIKIITPSEHLGGSLNLDRDNIEKNVDLGYLDTMKVYNRYDGNRYYFNVDFKYDEDYCFNKFRNMNKESIKNILDLLNIKRDVNLRTLLEVAIPKVGDLLELEKDFTYKDLYYSIYEKKLEENNINRIKLYDFNKVIDVISKNIDGNKNLATNISTNPIVSIQKDKIIKVLTNCFVKDFNKQK